MDSEVLMVSTCLTEKDWVLDSGCSYHMTPNRYWFFGYKEIDGGKVIMRNNSVCKVHGIGTIKLRVDDGSEKFLTGVRYVPDLKRNLISLGMPEESGCVYKAEKGILKIMKGSVVVMQAYRENGIYILKGHAITGF